MHTYRHRVNHSIYRQCLSALFYSHDVVCTERWKCVILSECQTQLTGRAAAVLHILPTIVYSVHKLVIRHGPRAEQQLDTLRRNNWTLHDTVAASPAACATTTKYLVSCITGIACTQCGQINFYYAFVCANVLIGHLVFERFGARHWPLCG